MSLVSLLKPGVTIYRSKDFARGTFTCFARNPGINGTLYGVTAKHVLPQGQTCIIAAFDATGNFEQLEIGGNPTHIAGVDFLYFEIHASVGSQLTNDNFIPLGYAVEPTQVWNPGKLVFKTTQAQTATAEEALKAKTMGVNFIGSTQATRAGNTITGGSLNKYSTIGTTWMQQTSIAKGDSGGCVLDPAKLRYVGFISSGHTDIASNSGTVILLHDAFARAGLILATWQDRAHWQ